MIPNRNNIKRYSDLGQLQTFEDRFRYLNLQGTVGVDTFGFDRYLNQRLYHSREWKQVRDYVIVRDNACDLGIPGRDIYGQIYVHHMNPINVSDIRELNDYLLNPEFLICVSSDTHNALHYGNESYLERNKIATRGVNDTSPWRK